MESVNVNIRKVKFHPSKKVATGNAETTLKIGDNLFSLMLITFAAVGAWAISAVLLL